MKYKNSGAFRRALETRLREQSLSSNLPLVRLRKMVAFDRLLARIFQIQPNQWILKGGLALQLRLGDRARTTKDIDLLYLDEDNILHNSLLASSLLDIGDWFSFEIGRPSNRLERNEGGLRHNVHALLDGRTFERFHLDVGIGDPVVEAADYLATPDLLSFAGIDPIVVPCYPITQQLAEKIRAYTKEYSSGRSSRVKDFVDMLLLAELGQLSGAGLTGAIEAAFQNIDARDIPRQLPPPPQNWEQGFKRMAEEVSLSEHNLASAYIELQRFIDPVLTGTILESYWQPENWSWS
ncbi:MAG: nucleotidyl transferase AbiEii/AbiGii toxin family protein [Ardenticatenaceae bacterium]|nr:nucleotidyl transferase AbiEii/AbiGii toxin family protein [Ardenticatenaceae bacterium]